MTESLCCAPEAITMLLIGYSSVQNKKFLKITKKKKRRAAQGKRRMKREARKAGVKMLPELSAVRSAGVGGSLAFDPKRPGVVAGRETLMAAKSTNFRRLIQ